LFLARARLPAWATSPIDQRWLLGAKVRKEPATKFRRSKGSVGVWLDRGDHLGMPIGVGDRPSTSDACGPFDTSRYNLTHHRHFCSTASAAPGTTW
jgi:hypothetical protein